MARGNFIFIALVLIIATGANAASVRGVSTASRTGNQTAVTQTANPASGYTYNYMYPYLNNKMRTTLNPGQTTSQSTSPINAIVRTEQLSAPRRVVPRPNPTTSARAASNTTSIGNSAQRQVVPRAAANAAPQRRVVARAATQTIDASRVVNTTSFPTENTPHAITPARCLADYTECMNQYCERTNTAYNRCYCSAKLAQIDAEYQPQIESLVQQLIALQSGGSSIDTAELNEYWATTIGKYTGDNSWQNLDDALNIDWSTMESRVRGQNAFITGHEYCAQHIAGCFYMASNLRDVYRSSIAQDCATYQTGLERLKNAAESIIREYEE